MTAGVEDTFDTFKQKKSSQEHFPEEKKEFQQIKRKIMIIGAESVGKYELLDKIFT